MKRLIQLVFERVASPQTGQIVSSNWAGRSPVTGHTVSPNWAVRLLKLGGLPKQGIGPGKARVPLPSHVWHMKNQAPNMVISKIVSPNRAARSGARLPKLGA